MVILVRTDSMMGKQKLDTISKNNKTSQIYRFWILTNSLANQIISMKKKYLLIAYKIWNYHIMYVPALLGIRETTWAENQLLLTTSMYLGIIEV